MRAIAAGNVRDFSYLGLYHASVPTTLETQLTVLYHKRLKEHQQQRIYDGSGECAT